MISSLMAPVISSSPSRVTRIRMGVFHQQDDRLPQPVAPAGPYQIYLIAVVCLAPGARRLNACQLQRFVMLAFLIRIYDNFKIMICYLYLLLL